MRAPLTQEAFGKLLLAFDADRDRAAEKYEALRRTLIRFFEWRSAPFPNEHTDETFDRVCRKIDDRAAIGNIGGYCYEVARLVCLEALKGRDRKLVSLDAAGAPMPAAPVPEDEAADKERRLTCLDECLRVLPPDRRELILEYYRDDRRARIDRRQLLAQRFGLQRETLANRAQRLRNKLEHCVAQCLGHDPSM